MRALKSVLVLNLILFSQMGLGYTIGGQACLDHGKMKLTGYFETEKNSVDEEIKRQTEADIILGLASSVTSDKEREDYLDSVTLIPIRYGQKLRLQNAPSSCEGLYFSYDQNAWISGDIFDQLSPYEKMVVYLEIFEERRNPETDRKILRKKAAFPLTSAGQTRNIQDWITFYEAFLGQTDTNFFYRGRYYFSSSLEFTQDYYEGIISKSQQSMKLGFRYYDLKMAKVLIQNNTIRQISFPGPVQIEMKAGFFRPYRITLNDDQSIQCAKLWKPSVLKNTRGEINLYPAESMVCFANEFVIAD